MIGGNSIMDKREIISKLYQLQEAMEHTKMELDELLAEGRLDKVNLLEQRHDQLYTSYWLILMDEVDARCREYVERIIGTGHFTEKIYIDELDLIMKCDDTIIDEYQGYTLTSGLDRNVNLHYWIYDSGGHLIDDVFDFISNSEAIICFRQMVDTNDFT